MRKIYKSALVVAAMIFASATFAQVVGSYKGIQNITYTGTAVKFTTDYPKANYEVLVDGVVVATMTAKFKADSYQVEIPATIPAGKSYTVKAVKKALNGTIASAGGYIQAGITAQYNSVNELPADVSVYFDGTQIVVAGAKSVKDLVAVAVSGTESYFASGSAVTVGAYGTYVVSAIINDNPVSVKIVVAK